MEAQDSGATVNGEDGCRIDPSSGDGNRDSLELNEQPSTTMSSCVTLTPGKYLVV